MNLADRKPLARFGGVNYHLIAIDEKQYDWLINESDLDYVMVHRLPKGEPYAFNVALTEEGVEQIYAEERVTP